MPVTGIKQVKQNMKRALRDIKDKNTVQFVHAVISIGVNHSKELTPIEYSNLINSIITDVTDVGSNITGTVFYMANYAAALEFRTWKPVAAVNKKGPADNMQAEPHFLRKGFESPESQSQIKQAEKIFKI